MTALWVKSKGWSLGCGFFSFCDGGTGSSIYRYKGFGDCNLWQTSLHKAVYCQAYCPSVTRASFTVKTKRLLFLWLANLENKGNVCKHISSLFLQIPVTGQVSQKSSGPKSCCLKSCCLESRCSKPRITLPKIHSHVTRSPESCCLKFCGAYKLEEK